MDSADDVMTIASNDQLIQAITQFYGQQKQRNQLKQQQNVFKAEVFLAQKYEDYSDSQFQSQKQLQEKRSDSESIKQQSKIGLSQGVDLSIFETCQGIQTKSPDLEQKIKNFQQKDQEYDDQRKKLEEQRKEFMESFYGQKSQKKSHDSLQFNISPICLHSIMQQLLSRNENKEIVYHKLVESGMLPESSRNDDEYEISDYGTRLKQIQNLILRSAKQHQLTIKQQQLQQQEAKNQSQTAVLEIKKVLETTDQDRKILNFSKKDFQITQENNNNYHHDDVIKNSQIMLKSTDNFFPQIVDPINPAQDVKNSQFYTLIHKRNQPSSNNSNKNFQDIKDSNTLEYLINQEQISYYPSYKTQTKGQTSTSPLTAKQSQQILGDSVFKELENRDELIVVKKQEAKQLATKQDKKDHINSSLYIAELKQFLATHQKETMTLMQNLDARFVGDIIMKAFVINSASQKQQKLQALKRFEEQAKEGAMLSIPLKIFMDIINKS